MKYDNWSFEGVEGVDIKLNLIDGVDIVELNLIEGVEGIKLSLIDVLFELNLIEGVKLTLEEVKLSGRMHGVNCVLLMLVITLFLYTLSL